MIKHQYRDFNPIKDHERGMADFWSDISGGRVHTGSWFGLPDFGATEVAASTLSGGQTNDLSSTLSRTAGGGDANDAYANSLWQGVQAQRGTAPTNINTNNGGGGQPPVNLGNYLQQGVDINAPGNEGLRAQQQAQDAQNKAAYEQELTAQVDASYKPASEHLNYLEQEYRSQQPIQEQQLTDEYGKVLPQIEQAQTAGLADVAGQRSKGKKSEQSEIKKARQLYNEMTQRTQAQFGGTSSAAQASQELLSRATAQQFGDIRQRFGDYYNSLAQEEGRLSDFYQSKKVELEQQKTTSLTQLRSTFDSKLREINSQRNVLEAEKAARKLEALNNYSMQVRAQQAQFDQMAYQLDQWRTIKNQTLQEAIAMGAKSVTIPGIPNTIGSMSMNFGADASSGGGFDWSQLQGILGSDELANSGLDLSSLSIGSSGKPSYSFKPKTNTTDSSGFIDS